MKKFVYISYIALALIVLAYACLGIFSNLSKEDINAWRLALIAVSFVTSIVEIIEYHKKRNKLNKEEKAKKKAALLSVNVAKATGIVFFLVRYFFVKSIDYLN